MTQHERPTVYLTNASCARLSKAGKGSERTKRSAGPGRVLSIMRLPRPEYGEAGCGRVLSLMPKRALLERTKARIEQVGRAEAWPDYVTELTADWRAELLRPDRLSFGVPVAGDVNRAVRWDGEYWAPRGQVQDGDTLICSCSVSAADAGHCHRVEAARWLVDAGWRVVLDGEDVTVVSMADAAAAVNRQTETHGCSMVAGDDGWVLVDPDGVRHTLAFAEEPGARLLEAVTAQVNQIAGIDDPNCSTCGHTDHAESDS